MKIFRSSSLIALAALLAITGCGGGCGNCTVPPVNGATLPPGGPTPTPGPAPLSCNQGAASIPLGPALAPFAVLAGSTVTNVGNTLVTYAPGATTGAFNDDLVGVSPGTAITGFYPPGTVTDGINAIYGAGYNTNAAVPLAAQNALIAANLLVGAKPATTTFAGGTDLATASVPGHPTGTLPPGVYASASTLSIMSGNLTLDGGGSAQSVFVFKIASGLTTTLGGAASGNVLLTNGATPCNIYWQIGSSAVLGGATFNGDVLANQSITINASTFNGRALASIGAVSIPVAGGSSITNPGGQ